MTILVIKSSKSINYMKNSTKVLIVGLGYVGLPLLNLISKNKKIESFGYDNDRYKNIKT